MPDGHRVGGDSLRMRQLTQTKTRYPLKLPFSWLIRGALRDRFRIVGKTLHWDYFPLAGDPPISRNRSLSISGRLAVFARDRLPRRVPGASALLRFGHERSFVPGEYDLRSVLLPPVHPFLGQIEGLTGQLLQDCEGSNRTENTRSSDWKRASCTSMSTAAFWSWFFA